MEPSNKDILIAAYLSSQSSEEESEEARLLLLSDPDLAGATKSWNIATREMFLDHYDTDHAWSRIKPQVSLPRRFNLYRTAAVAASLIFIAMITFFLINQKDRSTYAMLHQISTGTGEIKTVELTDGTKVTLNAGSTLRYPSDFKGESRDVYLEGEAFFDVTKNNRRPFMVHFGEFDVRVYSTSFNIEAYLDSKDIEVAVRSGKVSFSLQAKEGEGVALSAFQKGIYSRQSGRFASSLVSEQDFAWLEQKLVFESTPLSEAIEELNRWYGIQVSLDNKDLGNCRISATFQRQSSEEVLNAISLMLNLSTEKNGSRVVLSGDGCQLN